MAKPRLVQFTCAGSRWDENDCGDKAVFNMNDPQDLKKLDNGYGRNFYTCESCKDLIDLKVKQMELKAQKLFLEIFG